MKPKYSSEYLTPQANRRRSKRVSTSFQSDVNTENNFTESFFEKLMTCPVKRQLVLNLISSEKENIKEYNRKQAEEEKRKQHDGSPLGKLQRKYQCESPTALLRRRALEQRTRRSVSPENQADDRESCSSSQQSGDSGSASPLLFNKLLDGVIAYVEVRSKDQDRSNGAKALMRSMGATVRDQFTKDVTHVIFKDGSFTTYQRAKLMNVHLVSVLWIEAVRSSNMRVSEKKFPALGTEAYDHNVSAICSQMQRDYEEIIREEVRRSLATGTPLPSTKSLIGRRRTIMTPSTSRQFSQDFPSSQDKEVEQIINSGRITYDYGIPTLWPIKSSPEFTSDDDSDLGPCINGTIVERTQSNLTPIQEYAAGATSSVEKSSDPNIELAYIETSKSLTVRSIRKKDKDKNVESNKDLIDVDQDEIVNETSNERNNVSTPDILTDSIYNRSTPKLKSTLNSKSKSSFNITEDNSFSIPDENLYRRRTRQLKSNTNNSAKKRQEAVSNNSVYILSKNLYVNLAKPLDSCSNPLSSLQLSSEKDTVEISTSTNMSSLQISASDKEQNNIAKASMASTSTNMSALVISSDSGSNQMKKQENGRNCANKIFNSHVKSKTSKEKSFNSTSGDSSFSPLNINVIKNVLQSLEDSPKSDENVTRRRGGQIKSALPIGNANPCSLVEASPPKQRKESTENIQLLNNKKMERTQINKKPESNVNFRKSLGTRRKTLLSPCPQLTDEGSSSDDKSINSGQQSRDIQSDSELPTVKKSSRNRRKTFHHTDKSQLDNVGSKKVNKSCSEDSDVSEKKKRVRKLYNPDESVKEVLVSDEKEREKKRTEVKKRRSNDGVILNPNIIISSNILLTNKAKEFIEKNNMDLKKVITKDPEESHEQISSSRRGRKKKIEPKRKSVNSDDDEQQELAQEILNKKANNKPLGNLKKSVAKSEGRVKRRQSVRLSQYANKKLNFNSSTSSNDEKKRITVNSKNRRSTLEFQPLSQKSAKNKLKIDKCKQPTIVCTRMHKEDTQVFYQIVKKLGGFVIEDEVSERTTHLVAGEPKRTINMLRAIARGCWIVKQEWLFKSLEEQKWLPEEDYEETDFSCAVQKCRLQRQAFGPSFSMDIFQNCGPIYVARGSNPRCSDLRELVGLCKGKVVSIPRNAEIVIGDYVNYEGVTCVKETWLLDSITFNKRMPLKKYLISASRRDSLHV